MNLNQVTLPVNDMAAAIEFYRTLGFLQIVNSPHYARFECPEGATFSLLLEENHFTNGAIIYFEEEQLDQWVDTLVKKGIQFAQLPTDMSYLWREAILYDPSHNKIKLYWAGNSRRNPPWKMKPETAE